LRFKTKGQALSSRPQTIIHNTSDADYSWTSASVYQSKSTHPYFLRINFTKYFFRIDCKDNEITQKITWNLILKRNTSFSNKDTKGKKEMLQKKYQWTWRCCVCWKEIHKSSPQLPLRLKKKELSVFFLWQTTGEMKEAENEWSGLISFSFSCKKYSQSTTIEWDGKSHLSNIIHFTFILITFNFLLLQYIRYGWNNGICLHIFFLPYLHTYALVFFLTHFFTQVNFAEIINRMDFFFAFSSYFYWKTSSCDPVQKILNLFIGIKLYPISNLNFCRSISLSIKLMLNFMSFQSIERNRLQYNNS